MRKFKIKNIEDAYLENTIDYDKLREIEKNKETSNLTSRIQNVLKRAEIYTPLDVLKQMYFDVKLTHPYSGWSKVDGKERYKALFSRYKNMGEKSVDLFLDYLESEGFNFSKDYPAKTIEEVVEDGHKGKWITPWI